MFTWWLHRFPLVDNESRSPKAVKGTTNACSEALFGVFVAFFVYFVILPPFRLTALPPVYLLSPASRNSDALFQAGCTEAFATATAVRTMTRSCCAAPSYVNQGSTSSLGWW